MEHSILKKKKKGVHHFGDISDGLYCFCFGIQYFLNKIKSHVACSRMEANLEIVCVWLWHSDRKLV